MVTQRSTKETKEESNSMIAPSKRIREKAIQILEKNDIMLISAQLGNLHFIVRSQSDNGWYDVFRTKGNWSCYTTGIKKVNGKEEKFGREFREPGKSAYILACKEWLEGIK